MKKMIKLAGLAKPFLQKEAIAQPNTILVTRMDNGNSDMQFPNGQELDNDMYADALAMAEEKYAMGTKIEFIYMDEAGKGHEGELELRGEGDYVGPEFEDGKNDNARDKALIDLFDDFR